MADPAQQNNTKAVTHGFRSERTVIPGMEDEAEWERYLKGITENLAPEGALEQELAARIASLLWRLRRVTRHETATTRGIIEGIQSKIDYANARIADREEGGELISDARTYKDQERHLVLDPYYPRQHHALRGPPPPPVPPDPPRTRSPPSPPPRRNAPPGPPGHLHPTGHVPHRRARTSMTGD